MMSNARDAGKSDLHDARTDSKISKFNPKFDAVSWSRRTSARESFIFLGYDALRGVRNAIDQGC